jgi:3-oxoacyl-[acyl-carrier-protein] synthase II
MAGERRRVVVTGLGATTPLGVGVDALWSRCIQGESGIESIESFDASEFRCTVGGEVRDFEPTDFIDRKAARRMARFSQLALASTNEAFEDSGLDLDSADRERMGVILGNGNGGFPNLEKMAGVLFERGGMRIEPFFLPRILPNMAAANVAMRYGLLGYNTTVVTACAAGNHAIGEATEVIRRGAADVMVAGGTEAGFSRLGLAGFSVMRALTSQSDDPQRASRPFDAGRDGFVPAEGAASLILESEEHALKRGATIHAEIAGFGCSGDAYHLVMPDESGAGPVRAMRWAMEDAGVQPSEIDWVSAHGTSTPLNDAGETRALKLALGDAATTVAVSSLKSMIGHSFGAAGAIETVVAVRSIENSVVHPTINQETPDPECDLDYVPNKAREMNVDVVLNNAFGFGGQNACLIVRTYEENA